MSTLRITVDFPDGDGTLWEDDTSAFEAAAMFLSAKPEHRHPFAMEWVDVHGVLADPRLHELVEGADFEFATPPVQIVVHADIAEMMRSIPNSWTSASFRELLDKILMLIASTKDTPNA